METPNLPSSLFAKDFIHVYEPAEDTFLLLDALEQDLDNLRKNVVTCMEIGSGSGTVITAISKALSSGSNKGSRFMIATDINIEACNTTRKCAAFHQQNNIQVVRTDLAVSLLDRLEDSVDLLVFNPPYVPTDSAEQRPSEEKGIHLSWAGGFQGRQLIDIFLKSYVHRLLSKPKGVAYLVVLDKNNVRELSQLLLSEHHIEGRVVLQRKAGFESLSVIKYSYQ